MPSEARQRQRQDEDTDLGFVGHMTNQSGDQTEQQPDDRKRRETGPEKSPKQPGGQEQRREKQGNRN